MALIGMRYLNAISGDGTGRIEIGTDHIRVRLNGGWTRCELDIIRISGSERIDRTDSCKTDENGRADVTIQGIYTCEDDVYMICTKEKLILYDRTLTEEKAIRMFRKTKREYNEGSKKMELPIKDTIAQTPGNKAVQNETVHFKCESSETVADMLPELAWPAEWNMWKAHFHLPPKRIDWLSDALNWKFVAAEASMNDQTVDCILGRHAEKDAVDGLCVIVSERHIPAQSYLPGFQYKKSPDGRGWWIRLEKP